MGAPLIFFLGILIFLLWPHGQGPITNEDWIRYYKDKYETKLMNWGEDHHITHEAYKEYKEYEASVSVLIG